MVKVNILDIVIKFRVFDIICSIFLYIIIYFTFYKTTINSWFLYFYEIEN